MVIPRSRSMSIESSSCASMSLVATVFVINSSVSASVDLPWSMCAMMEKLRNLLRGHLKHRVGVNLHRLLLLLTTGVASAREETREDGRATPASRRAGEAPSGDLSARRRRWRTRPSGHPSRAPPRSRETPSSRLPRLA